MKKMVIVFIALLSIACQGGSNRKDEAAYVNKSEASPGYDASVEEQYAPEAEVMDRSDVVAGNTSEGDETIDAEIGDETRIQPQLIKTADLRFRVKDVELSTENIEAMAAKAEGFVSNSSLRSSNSEVSNYITIRVPAKNFDVLLKSISKESEYMERKEIHTEDVTEEYIDIQTRLKTKKEVEQRYIQILKEKAKTVQDIYTAEEQIRIIREEIEAKEGRLNYLQNQVAYSTITVDLFQQVEYKENPEELTYTFGHRLEDSVGSGWNVVVNIFLGLLSLWPLWIISLIIYWAVRRKIKKYKANKS